MAEPLKHPTPPWWPALLSGIVIPGAGQILNRDFFKGIFLIAVTLGSLIWMTKVLIERLALLLPGTPDQWQQNPNIVREAVTNLVNQTPGMFVSFEVLLLLVWIYGIVDAYMIARQRLQNPPAPIETENPDR